VIVYLDSSVVLRVLLRQGEPLDSWGEWEAAYSSEILGLEARRTLDRLRLDGALDDQGVAEAHGELARMERSVGQIDLTPLVLRRAAMPMATVVRTLDAIHIASALLLQERTAGIIIFATHDAQQATGARALGFDCIGV